MQIIPVQDRKPIFSWCPNAEQGAIDQITAIAKLPFVVHTALMPDAHMGMSMPIGGVVATKGIVLPNCVGVDIGCGVIACKTSLLATDLFHDDDCRKRIHHGVSRGIPMGFAHNTQRRINELKTKLQDKVAYLLEKSKIEEAQFGIATPEDAVKMLYEQLGTLGGGNHFIEVQHAEDDNHVWLMVHSGSRNIGKKVCDLFNKIAAEENLKWHSVDTNGIPFLPTDSDAGRAYLAWMQFALRFAYLNRAVMLGEVKNALLSEFPDCEFEPEINIHHNYAAIENHNGENVWVHRKGATEARDTTVGIIPGSMGTASYIVKGLGNEKSLMSCSHGSGRVMGRMEFNRQFNTEEKIKQIEKTMDGITHTGFGKGKTRKGEETGMLDLSEAPQAYKDIDEVMSQQADLVKPLHRLLPLINWKDVGEE